MNKIITISLLILVTACAPKIKNLALYSNSPIHKSEFLPTKDKLQKNTISVVVMPFEEKDIELAKKASLSKSLATEVENLLAKNKIVKTVDRNSIKKLKGEVILSEMKKTGSFEGLSAADYAISGDISNVGFAHKYISRKIQIDSRSGQVSTVPPRHKYTATFAGSIKIYSLPSLEVIDTIPLNGKEYRYENAIVDSSFFGLKTEVKTDAIAKEDNGLVRKVAKTALERQAILLSNTLSNLRRGYIIGKKAKGKKVIFRINFGYDDGIKHGDRIAIYKTIKTENPITEEEEIENIQISDGVVSDQISSGSAWIIVKNKDVIDSIEIGNFILVQYKKGFGGKLKDIGRVIGEGADTLGESSASTFR